MNTQSILINRNIAYILPPSACVQKNLLEHRMARFPVNSVDQLDLQALSATNQQAEPLAKAEPLHDLL